MIGRLLTADSLFVIIVSNSALETKDLPKTFLRGVSLIQRTARTYHPKLGNDWEHESCNCYKNRRSLATLSLKNSFVVFPETKYVALYVTTVVGSDLREAKRRNAKANCSAVKSLPNSKGIACVKQQVKTAREVLVVLAPYIIKR